MKKNVDINLYGAKEMTQQEMISTEGGDLVVVGLLLLATAVLSSCVDVTINIKSNNNNTDGSVNNQGTGNGNGNGSGNGNGNNNGNKK
ncbi:hypothetical protein [Leyella stercorea]|uniref:hypothetical protein n=1 Tax=Leyella stercorea TaxID=363265 RepID=UPI00242E7995|nr:hypothetical protein [Leyella stercorea]